MVLPAIGTFQRHSPQLPLLYWSPSGGVLLLQSPLPVVVNALGV
jgi:hypothetical protein